MATTVTSRGIFENGTSTSQTHASTLLTPAANSVWIIHVAATNDSHGTAKSWSLTGGAEAYTDMSLDEGVNHPFNFFHDSKVYRQTFGATPAARTVTVDPWGGSQAGWIGISITEIAGDVDTSDPIAQAESGVAGDSSGAGNLNATTDAMASAPSGPQLALCSLDNDSTPAFDADPSGFTEQDEDVTGNIAMWTGWSTTNTATTVTMGSASGTNYTTVTCLIEFNETASGGVDVGQAAEVDTAGVVTPAPGAGTVPVAQAAEVDTAGVVTPAAGSVTVVIGQAVEVDDAGVVTAAPGPASVPVGQASEVDTAGVVTPAQGGSGVPVGQAVEVDDAGVVTAAPGPASVPVGQASEVDTAGTVAAVPDGAVAVGQAVEVDDAGVVTPTPGPVNVAVDQAAEVDTAGVVTPAQGGSGVPIGQATEADTADGLTITTGPISAGVGQATEVDTGGVVTPDAVTGVPVGQATEVDTALVLAVVLNAVNVAVGQAAEVDTAGVVTPIPDDLILALLARGYAGPAVRTWTKATGYSMVTRTGG